MASVVQQSSANSVQRTYERAWSRLCFFCHTPSREWRSIPNPAVSAPAIRERSYPSPLPSSSSAAASSMPSMMPKYDSQTSTNGRRTTSGDLVRTKILLLGQRRCGLLATASCTQLTSSYQNGQDIHPRRALQRLRAQGHALHRAHHARDQAHLRVRRPRLPVARSDVRPLLAPAQSYHLRYGTAQETSPLRPSRPSTRRCLTLPPSSSSWTFRYPRHAP